MFCSKHSILQFWLLRNLMEQTLVRSQEHTTYVSIFCKLYLDQSFLGSGLQQIVVSEMFVLLMPPCAVKSSMCTALLEESPHKDVNSENSKHTHFQALANSKASKYVISRCCGPCRQAVITQVQNHLKYTNFDQKPCKYVNFIWIAQILLALANLMIYGF